MRSSVSTTELKAAQSRITIEEQNRKEVQSKRQIAADSLQSIQLQILEIDTNVEVGSELGPLEYLSGLLGKPMDVIINWFILIIIFVFDPLAICMVLAFNYLNENKEEQKQHIIDIMKSDEELGLYEDVQETKSVEDIEVIEPASFREDMATQAKKTMALYTQRHSE
jgi:hypothetical protein